MARQRNEAARNATAKHKDRILGLPGVTGIFTGEKTTGGKKTGQQSVVVTVAHKKPLSEISATERIPGEIDGIPTDVIEEVFRPCSDESRYDPLVGGTSISVTPEIDSSFSSGTAGMIVSDAETGDRMILSCWHVLYGAGVGTDGDIVTNPPYAGGDPTPDQVGTTTRFSLSSTVDGAVALATGRATSPSIVDIGTPTAIGAASVDMVVRKRGKTSGLTVGVVTATDWSGLIDYGPPVGVQSFTNMIRFEGAPGMVLGGDSGSVLVASEGGQLIVENWVEDSEPGNHTFGLDSDHVSNKGAAHNTSVSRDVGESWTLTGTVETTSNNSVQLAMGTSGLAFQYVCTIYAAGEGSLGGWVSATTLDDENLVDPSHDYSDGSSVTVTAEYDAGTNTLTCTFDDGMVETIVSQGDPSPPPGGTTLYPSVRVYSVDGVSGGADIDDLELT